MHGHRARIAPVLIMLLFAACARTEDAASTTTAANDPAAVRTMIDSANRAATAAMKAGDSVGMLANYADDAVVLMANHKVWRGRAEAAAGYAGLMSMFAVKDATFTTTDVLVEGDVAIETGEYRMTLTPKGGGADIPDEGKYLTVWRKQSDGSWKIIREAGNTSLPAAH